MPFHLAGYTLLIGNVVDTDIPAMTDDILTVQNNHFVLSQGMNMIAAMVMSPTLARAKVASPSMRQIASPYVRPIIIGTTPPTNPNWWLLNDQPFSIPPYEEIQVLGTAAPGVTERFTALLWLSTGVMQIPSGNIIPLRWTSTTAAVANAWSSVTITFADTLPSGVYTMVDSFHTSANGIAHRWIISNQLMRPGFPSYASVGSRHPFAVDNGGFGVLGSFRSNDLPRCQVLANAADAVHEGYLHVIRTGNLAA